MAPAWLSCGRCGKHVILCTCSRPLYQPHKVRTTITLPVKQQPKEKEDER